MAFRLLLLRKTLKHCPGLVDHYIHELSEDECLKHFSVVRLGIELILDQKIEERARQRKLEEASKAINMTLGSMGQNNTGPA
ncbi:hypothetical protein GCM10007071_11210 [Marinobacter zhanjiangensis]|uniref:Uncharacterized protein n=1 Tax=Marinobacter zhanjiangensis TaxID=578215 RepID=A0ABQ3ATD0_9GAMM|nr:hypothetical protein GCM10007071_11210 [Marinobacter zhanjiangensis]